MELGLAPTRLQGRCRGLADVGPGCNLRTLIPGFSQPPSSCVTLGTTGQPPRLSYLNHTAGILIPRAHFHKSPANGRGCLLHRQSPAVLYGSSYTCHLRSGDSPQVRQAPQGQPGERSERHSPRKPHEAAGSPAPFLHLPRGTERAAGTQLGPRCPGPLRPGRATPPGPPRLRPLSRPRRGSAEVGLGDPRRSGGCYSPRGAACAASFVCKHPGWRARCQRRPAPGAGPRGGGGTTGRGPGRGGARAGRGRPSRVAPGASRGAGRPNAFRARRAQAVRASLGESPGSASPSSSPTLAFPWAWDLRLYFQFSSPKAKVIYISFNRLY